MVKDTFVPNSEQESAIECKDSKILCLAGAGTGKTASMIHRIIRIVNDGGEPSSILCLTFTNAAAFEMKERYKNLMNDNAIPEFRTFHSFCYHLLSIDVNVRRKLGYSDIPSIASDGDIKLMKSKSRLACGTKISDSKLMSNKSLSISESFERDVFWKYYNKLLRRSGLITFDILCYDVCKLFVDDDSCIRRYKSKYKYIFVDEFQDTDPKQYEFVSSFKDSDMFVVGDALQNIYSFRGSDSSIIKGLSVDENWTTIKLFQNYRSTKDICDFANSASKYADNSYRIEIQSKRNGEDVTVKYMSEPTYECPVDCDSFKYIVDKINECQGTSAVLCRTNSEVDFIVDKLKEKGLNCKTSNKNSDNIHILKSVLDNDYMINWLSTFLNAEEYANFTRLSCIFQDEKSTTDIFLNNFGNVFKVKPKLESILSIRKILRSDRLKVQKCADILSTLDMPLNIDINIDVNTAKEFITNLIEYTSDMLQSYLYVGTIHSSKGLEYDNVILVNVDTKLFKLSNEENLNLYYVGITRARNKLYILK